MGNEKEFQEGYNPDNPPPYDAARDKPIQAYPQPPPQGYPQPPPQGYPQPPPQGYPQPPPLGYAQPPVQAYGQPMMPQGPQQTHHIVQHNALNYAILGREPVSIDCRNCGEHVTTMITTENSGFAWMMAGFICFIGLWCGCCLLPLMVDNLKDVSHSCPKCRAYLGKYKAKM